MAIPGHGNMRGSLWSSRARRRARRLLVPLAAIAATLWLVTSPEAAIRFKRTGESTLGGADALAEIPGACEVGPNHVWVSVAGRGECIAFYASGSLNDAKHAVLYFEGDIPSGFRRNPAKLGHHLSSLRRSLDMLAAAFHVPYALIARPGTFGSTGNHGDRRKDREYLVMRAAVDALRLRFGLESVSLAGQSGGATIVGGLLVLGVSHVKCAVPASGGYDLTAMLDWHSGRLGVTGAHREHPAILSGDFNVMDHLTGIRRDSRRRIFILGDPRDQVTPFVQQKSFADAIRAAGHNVELLEGEGRGPERHGLSFTALKLAGLCASGAGNAEIKRAATGP